MDIFFNIAGLGNSLLSYILPFLFVLTLVVFFHELGHFSVARYFDTKIDTFSIGFGPEIFGWYDRKGTRWRVSWLPLGGYVRFFGDDSAASTPDREHLKEKAAQMSAEERAACFHFKPLYQRALIVAAGPIANFILAIVIFTIVLMIFGQHVLTPRVDEVQPGSAAEVAGIRPGDVIVEIDGRRIKTFGDLQSIVSLSAETPLRITLDRNGEQIQLTVTPRRGEITDRFGNVHKVGLLGISRQQSRDEYTVVQYGPVGALVKGVERTWYVVTGTFNYLGRIITGREDADQLGGPLRIAQVSGQVATLGFVPLLELAAILSISIGLLNLFPIPLLDGGHLLYYGYEAVAGRPLGERAQEMGFRVGLAFVLSLMLFATWNDLVHLPILNGLKSAVFN